MSLETGSLESKRIVLSADSLGRDLLAKIVGSENFLPYIRAIKVSRRLIDEFGEMDEITTLSYAAKLDIIGDLQLSGGYEDMVADALSTVRKHHLSAMTVAPGTTIDAVRFLRDRLGTDVNTASLFLTGALPEVSPEGCMIEFRASPEQYNTMRTEAAATLGLYGIYGATVYARGHNPKVKYMGAGIALDSIFVEEDEETRRKPRVRKVATTISGAIGLGVDLPIVGHVLADSDRPLETFEKLVEKLDEAINGPTDTKALKGV